MESPPRASWSSHVQFICVPAVTYILVVHNRKDRQEGDRRGSLCRFEHGKHQTSTIINQRIFFCSSLHNNCQSHCIKALSLIISINRLVSSSSSSKRGSHSIFDFIVLGCVNEGTTVLCVSLCLCFHSTFFLSILSQTLHPSLLLLLILL